MKLGISSYAFSWAVGVPGYPAPSAPMTAEDLLNKAVSRGVHVVQIADNLPLDQLPPPELDRLERRAAELDIRIEVGTRGISPPHLRDYIRLAQRFRSPILRTVPDTSDHHPTADEVIEALRPLVPDLRRAGVKLAIENHDRFKAQTLLEIIERIGAPEVGVCLDTANSFGCLEGPETVLETLGPHVVNFHVKDVCVRRLPHKFGFLIEGRPAGQGQLDIPRLLTTLGRQGHDPSVILEQWPPPEKTVDESIAKEAEWAVDSIEYLRQYIAE